LEKLVRKRIVTVGKIFIGIGLIIFLTFYVKPEKIYLTFIRADKGWLIVTVLLLPLNLFLQFLKWKLLSDEYFSINNNKATLLSLFYGISGGIFTPMKSGEYFARALPYPKVKMLDVILATVVDKLVPVLFVLLIGGMFFIIYLKSLFELSVFATVLFIVAYKIILLLILFLLLGNGKFSAKLKTQLKTKKYFARIFERVSFLKKISPEIFGKIIIISFLYHLTFTLQMSFLLIAYSGVFNLPLFFFAANLIIFAQIVIPPVAFGEIGVREGTAVYLLHNLGFSAAVGFNAAISLFAINLLFPSVVGLVLLLKRG
jgi:uncharacterized membrane protein YbhN (UPF0104 family)